MLVVMSTNDKIWFTASLCVAVVSVVLCFILFLSKDDAQRWQTSSTKRLPRYAVNQMTLRRLFQSPNTKQSLLDDFIDCEHPSDGSLAIKCDTSLTDESCVACKRADTKCVRLNVPTTLKRPDGTQIVLPPNDASNSTEGYCIPVVSGSTSSSTLPDAAIKCNVNTADAILTTVAVNGESVWSGYALKCICKYPSLVTQLGGPNTDCDQQVACAGGRGKLVSRVGFSDWKVGDKYMGGDLKESTECTVCPPGTLPGRDAYKKPTCLPSLIGDSFDDAVYKTALNATLAPNNGFEVVSRVLPVRDNAQFGTPEHAIDPAFVAQFSNAVRSAGNVVPNPCSVDGLSGKPFTANECSLYSAPALDGNASNDSRIYYCVPNVPGVVGIRYDDSNLRNNNNKYANGCARVINTTGKDDDGVNAYLFEWFNVNKTAANPSLLVPPIVGFNVNAESVSPEAVALLGGSIDGDTASFYSAMVPDTAPVFPFPIDQKYAGMFSTQDSSDTIFPSKCYYPYLFKNVPCGLFGVRSSVTVPPCAQLGREIASATPFMAVDYFWNYNLMLDERQYAEKLSTVFSVCKSYSDDPRFAFVPNYKLDTKNLIAQNFTSMFKFDVKKRLLSTRWPRGDALFKGDILTIRKYVAHLPSLPPSKL